MYEAIIFTLAILTMICIFGAVYAWREERRKLLLKLKCAEECRDFFAKYYSTYFMLARKAESELAKYKRPRLPNGRFK